jgi:hypothetical protein
MSGPKSFADQIKIPVAQDFTEGVLADGNRGGAHPTPVFSSLTVKVIR